MGKFTDQTFRTKILLITNIITGAILIGFLLSDKYTQQTYSIHNPPIKRHSFLDNTSYIEQTDFYTVYVGQKNIVMFGNSLTYRINWGELLERTDVANRGIGSDITSGFINRLNFVLNLHPKFCFIEGGVNDIAFNINQDSTIRNLNYIVHTLLNNKIKPVLMTVTYVTKSYPNAIIFNQKIKVLNKQIIKISKEKGISLIDLNLRLTDGEFLSPEYAVDDGIHFKSKAYLIWKAEILKVLEQEKI